MASALHRCPCLHVRRLGRQALLPARCAVQRHRRARRRRRRGRALRLHPLREVTYRDPDFSVASTQSSTIGNEHLFTGRRTDPQTGLQLNRRRFYHAPLGRWVNRDPIGYAGGVNLYLYVDGYPVGSVDSSGLQPGRRHGGQKGSPAANLGLSDPFPSGGVRPGGGGICLTHASPAE